MKLYVMSGRCGVLMETPVVSTGFEELQALMQKKYREAMEEHEDDGSLCEDCSCINEDSACVPTGSDWLEWKITSHEIDVPA